MIIDTREKEISDKDTIDKIINLINGCKYIEPRDDNERGYNRWIDWSILHIRNYILDNS